MHGDMFTVSVTTSNDERVTWPSYFGEVCQDNGTIPQTQHATLQEANVAVRNNV